ncbi:MAG: TRAP transporter substrate-binding protein DctP [Deltaproteobacteria bacterium]|nr:TRAP transporter substrate-binding protein DctP [Deltaproteobacteria bacterium]
MKPPVLVVAAVVLALSWSHAAVAEPQQIRMATLAPAGSPWVAVMERAAAEITDATDGRITIKYFTGGQQGDERDFIRKINLGQLDGAAVTSAGLAMIEPSILVLQLPLLFQSEAEVDYVATKMWPYFQKKFEAKGFRLADRGEIGWIYFFSKSKVTSIADLRKQKLWTLGDDQLGTSVVDKLKLNGIPLGIPEVDAALTSGRINACFSSPLGAIALQWYTKLKYMSSTPMLFAIGATVLSLDAVKKLSAEDRAIIEKVAKRNQKKARAVIRKANVDARTTIIRKGITIVDVPQPMLDELTAVAVEVQAELVGKVYSKDELDRVIAYRDEYRAKQPKAAAK